MKDRLIWKNKKVLLGLTGSVAIYRSVDLARRLTRAGAEVYSILTDSAQKFITPILIESITGKKPFTDTFQTPMAHIELAQNVEVFAIAPATANIIGKFSSGIGDDMLSTVFLAIHPSKILIAPAMNWRMYENPVVQENIRRLKKRGISIIGPEAGELCCGEEGYGRMSDIEDIIDEMERIISRRDLEGLKILVTAGPTREYLDPVRFLTNRSSGKMGYALARVARRRGAEVTLISGPCSLRKPYGVKTVFVETTDEMKDAVIENAVNADMVFMAAAPSDFTFKRANQKIPRKEGTLSIELFPTSDIIGTLGRHSQKPFLVGFSAETSLNTERAKEKLQEKGLDMIVLNNVREAGAGFDVDTNRVIIIDRSSTETTELLSKEEIASIIIDRAMALIAKLKR